MDDGANGGLWIFSHGFRTKRIGKFRLVILLSLMGKPVCYTLPAKTHIDNKIVGGKSGWTIYVW